jgi:hypothetical protein
MKVLLLLADYANVTADGKVNVLGIFNQIKAYHFPTRHSSMFLVAKLTLEFGEPLTMQACQINLYDEDSKTLVEIPGEIFFQKPSELGVQPETNIILSLSDIVFPQPGVYMFVLLVNGEQKAEIPLQVVSVEHSRSA